MPLALLDAGTDACTHGRTHARTSVPTTSASTHLRGALSYGSQACVVVVVGASLLYLSFFASVGRAIAEAFGISFFKVRGAKKWYSLK